MDDPEQSLSSVGLSDLSQAELESGLQQSHNQILSDEFEISNISQHVASEPLPYNKRQGVTRKGASPQSALQEKSSFEQPLQCEL